MSAYVHELRNLKLTNRALMVALLVLCLAIVGLTFGLVKLSRSITVYIPPDTTQGATVQAGIPDAANVYGFANYIYQYINHWPNDGEQDYKQRIFDVTNYVTPNFKSRLDRDYRHAVNNNGINELKNRVRQLELDPNHLFKAADVTRLADGVWTAELVYRLIENVGALEVKNVLIKVPLRIVKVNVDQEKNQFALQIDDYAGSIERLNDPRQLSQN